MAYDPKDETDYCAEEEAASRARVSRMAGTYTGLNGKPLPTLPLVDPVKNVDPNQDEEDYAN